MDTSHLSSLQVRLSHERARFAADGSVIRKVWISQIEREISHELEFLGMADDGAFNEMTDDELLAALAE